MAIEYTIAGYTNDFIPTSTWEHALKLTHCALFHPLIIFDSSQPLFVVFVYPESVCVCIYVSGAVDLQINSTIICNYYLTEIVMFAKPTNNPSNMVMVWKYKNLEGTITM